MNQSMVSVMQAEQMRDSARKSAIFSGDHKFIWLTLINDRYQRITGVEVVDAMPYIDERAGGITRFNLHVRGGDIKFNFDPSKNSFVYPMLDSNHNRAFLASHYHTRMWKIDDAEIDKEIAGMSKKIEKDIIKYSGDKETTPPVKIDKRFKKNKPPETLDMTLATKEIAGAIKSDMVTPAVVR